MAVGACCGAGGVAGVPVAVAAVSAPGVAGGGGTGGCVPASAPGVGGVPAVVAPSAPGCSADGVAGRLLWIFETFLGACGINFGPTKAAVAITATKSPAPSISCRFPSLGKAKRRAGFSTSGTGISRPPPSVPSASEAGLGSTSSSSKREVKLSGGAATNTVRSGCDNCGGNVSSCSSGICCVISRKRYKPALITSL